MRPGDVEQLISIRADLALVHHALYAQLFNAFRHIASYKPSLVVVHGEMRFVLAIDPALERSQLAAQRHPLCFFFSGVQFFFSFFCKLF